MNTTTTATIERESNRDSERVRERESINLIFNHQDTKVGTNSRDSTISAKIANAMAVVPGAYSNGTNA